MYLLFLWTSPLVVFFNLKVIVIQSTEVTHSYKQGMQMFT
jgi:hypothetical protein